MVFRLRLAERQLRLELTDHDPNLPQEVRQQVGRVAALLDPIHPGNKSSSKPVQLVSRTGNQSDNDSAS